MLFILSGFTPVMFCVSVSSPDVFLFCVFSVNDGASVCQDRISEGGRREGGRRRRGTEGEHEEEA